ncbi:hypothetical protein [Microbacterium deminutum]
MGIDEIWAELAPETRDWLVANNGDAIPADIAAEIDGAVDAVVADDVWASDSESPGADAADHDEPDDGDDELGARYLTDEAVDWIEELANEDDIE